ncbi:hypothetical protein A1OQ_14035 [Enterovibrio norvegicus FF-162]|uniref:hypothetical protein n=1 Tax=Enterovibrio norvegicus TaxID=188144 RepID=UPI0002DCA0B8|nr:hypothetical protein [Enterovibrio norvegicus]OEE87937.1 hypothetical protein A1OQ_14035 [Enterovibrio norvegicus FF-162]
MSDYKKAIVFEDTEKPEEAPELTAQRQFDAGAATFSVAQIEEETDAEQRLEAALKPKKKRQ